MLGVIGNPSSGAIWAKDCPRAGPSSQGSSLAWRQAPETTQARLRLPAKTPAAGPVALEDLIQSIRGPAGHHDRAADRHAGLAEEREPLGAGPCQGVDHGTEHLLPGGGQRQPCEGCPSLLDACPLAGEVRVERKAHDTTGRVTESVVLGLRSFRGWCAGEPSHKGAELAVAEVAKELPPGPQQ